MKNAEKPEYAALKGLNYEELCKLWQGATDAEGRPLSRNGAPLSCAHLRLALSRRAPVTPEAIRKGVETRRKRRTFRESIRAVLSMEVPDTDKRQYLEKLGLDGTMLDAINLAVSERASLGDVEAARFLRDTVGEKPRDGLEIGNLDDKPLASLDMSKLTDDQLRALVAQRQDEDLG